MRRILKAVFLNAMLAIAGNDVRAQGVRLPSAFITGQAFAGLPENARTQYVTGLVDGIFVAVLFGASQERVSALERCLGLVSRRVNLIAALAPPAVFAAKTATTAIPIVFVGALDPVKAGLVASLNRPGGNITGITFIGASLGGKRLELARELMPNVGVVALLTHPHSPDALEELRELESVAKATGQQLLVVSATTDQDFEGAFASIVQHRAGVLLVGSDPFFFQRTEQLVALAERYRIPAIYPTVESVPQGGLMSYGASIADAWRLAGVYAGRMLKGTKPADLPVVQPTKFDLVINLITAKVIGVSIPPTLLARADEVIE